MNIFPKTVSIEAKHDDAMFHVMNTVDDMLHEGKFKEVDEILEAIVPEEYEFEVLMAFMSICLMANELKKINNYYSFIDKCKTHSYYLSKSEKFKSQITSGFERSRDK